MASTTICWAVALLSGFVYAAPPLFESEEVQLTQSVFDRLSLAADVSLFLNESTAPNSVKGRCKVYPGDAAWPSETAWSTLNELVDGRLLKPRPQGAICYPSAPEYNAALCAEKSAKWNTSYIHIHDPIEMMSPVYQGLTCVPPNVYDSGNCTQGGMPLYVINATTPKHVQAGINFARNTGIRLVVKNTGHDFSGKSGGGQSLSIWTHWFKEIQYIEQYKDEKQGYSGPAFKCGTGVQAFEIYKAASEKSRVVVGGEGETVGVMGGYIQGGGHSPLTPLYGIGADNALAFEVVTADGRFVTADSTQNTDLFWAMRGGGGSTFGVATSVTVKAHPDMPTTASIFRFNSTMMGKETFWAGVRTYFDYFEQNADAQTYAYVILIPNAADNSFTFGLTPFFAPNKTVEQVHTLLDPWFERLHALGIDFDPQIKHYNTWYEAWRASFPLEAVEKVNVQSGSRLFPRSNFQTEEKRNLTFGEIRKSSELGRVQVWFNIKATDPANADNAVNSHWRENLLFALQSVRWNINATAETILATRHNFTHGDMKRWQDISPDAGSYLAESDRMEVNFGYSFWGTKYPRLLELKAKWDPNDVFYAATAVGSERWNVETADGLPHENGKLCRVESQPSS